MGEEKIGEDDDGEGEEEEVGHRRQSIMHEVHIILCRLSFLPSSGMESRATEENVY